MGYEPSFNPGSSASSPARRSADAAGDGRVPRGWHNRGFLPHCDLSQLHQVVSYRLADSLPAEVAQPLPHELDRGNGDTAYRRRIEAYLDAGHGECLLRRPEIAQVVIDGWNHFDGVRYDLRAWVVMPNHVHVLIAMREVSLSAIMHGWKSFTARKVNAVVGRKGRLWQADYWDRYIRDDQHYGAAVEYILANPGPRGSSTAWAKT